MTTANLRGLNLSNIVALALLVFSAAQLRAQQVTPPADQPAPAAPVSQWPQRVDSADGLITIYQPQPNKFEGDTLTARAAVSLTPPGATDPEFGAVWFTARVSTDRDARIVTIQNITIKQVKLPDAAADQETKFGQVLQQQIPAMNLMLSLDQLEATLGVVQKEKQEAQQMDNTPPKIVFTTTPTTLVLLDGPPKLQESQTQGVMSVVNTPFILLLDMSSKRYFLKAGDTWMVAPFVTGPWASASADLPAGIAVAGTKLSAQSPPANGATPQPAGPTAILVAEEPTELIATQGPPTYSPIGGNDLLYLSNTQSDVFLTVSTQQYYVLLSGRWFQGASLQGPWTFAASDKLPAAMAQISADSPKANVLVSIAGTQPAKDAKMDAFIPQTTAIKRDSGSNLNVSYDGEPQFVPVENTPITYASNCVDPVLFVENSYYCCHEAVWYRSNVAVGPWVVCDSVPQVIYTLPPSCPVYNCRYVYVYDSTPDVVYCGYLPGYTGCYVYGPTVVYGTGYRYPYWYHTHFIPRPNTWGFAASYDYYSGTWGLGVSFNYGPTWFAQRPDHRNWFGPQGYVDYREVHNRFDHRVVENQHIENRTIVHNETINRINIYNRQENTPRNLPGRREVSRREDPKTPAARRELPPAENNVYVGQDGGVYRRTDKGWETHDAKGWSDVKTEPPRRDVKPDEHIQQTPQTPQRIEPPRQAPPVRVDPGLENDHIARQRGIDRSGGGGEQQHAAPPVQQRPPTGGGAGTGGGNPGGGAGRGAGGQPRR
jgi:hypothetical protein